MTTVKFQTESNEPVFLQQDYDHHPALDLTGEKAQTAIEAILLGLHLRPWLATSENRLLELLAPAPACVFLVKDENLIGSQNRSQPAISSFKNSLLSNSDAIFIDHYRPDTASEAGDYRIHTATVGNIDGAQLILGLTAPENIVSPPNPEDRFAALVEQFRQAMLRVAPVAEKVNSGLQTNAPALVIHRTSGRVLVVNQAATELLKTDLLSLVDLEYSSLSKRLSQAATHRGLRMKNTSAQGIHLTIVTILPERSPLIGFSNERLFSEFFVHTMRNKIASITAASSHLGSTTTGTGQTETNELAAIILEEATELNRHLERLRLLTIGNNAEKRSVSMVEALSTTIERIEKRYQLTIEKGDLAGELSLYLKAVPGAIEFLLEATLHSQLASSRQSGVTRVNLTQEGGTLKIDVKTKLVHSTNQPQFSDRWRAYAVQLATTLGYAYTNEESKSGIITSTISIPDGVE